METENNYDIFFEANRDGWNKRTMVHVNSSFYGNVDFKAGQSSLNAVELKELGDVRGKSMLHLQCHFGQDSLSWAAAGAEVTGVDLSDKVCRGGPASALVLVIKSQLYQYMSHL